MRKQFYHFDNESNKIKYEYFRLIYRKVYSLHYTIVKYRIFKAKYIAWQLDESAIVEHQALFFKLIRNFKAKNYCILFCIVLEIIKKNLKLFPEILGQKFSP